LSLPRTTLQVPDEPSPENPPLQNLAYAVQMARGEESWSRRQLAEKSGLSERFIADVENGTANPSVESIVALARALDLHLGRMLTGEGFLTPRLGSLLKDRSEPQQDQIADWIEERLGARPPARRIALLGVRGAGKTTVGQLLARSLSCPFIELDRLVEESAGHKLAQIFELHGDAYYRRIEREVLQKVVAGHRDAVIATGGGLVTSEETFSLLRSQCRTVWLKARPSVYLARVRRQGDRRPFDQHPQALLELTALLAAREPAYKRADFVVDTTQSNAEAVSRRIASWAGRLDRRSGSGEVSSRTSNAPPRSPPRR
jgi:XRE family aerobic/anaerobic benzoate catabolism transcriptional regulator